MMQEVIRLEPRIYIDTLTDGRGGIFNWVPEHTIKEFNFMYYNKGIQRGNHHHPHFHEYMILTSGSGVSVSKIENGKKTISMSQGVCIYIPKGVSHVFHAITDCTAVSFLSELWDESDPPIIHEELLK
jgi:mannose-6-phosphate isomerase-like protein (cupin superfamily)